MELTDLVEKGLSTRQIAKALGKSQGYVKYNLKKLGLKTKHLPYNKNLHKPTEKVCNLCNILKPVEEFYFANKERTKIQGRCKKCSNQATIDKMVSTKIKMIEYKGAECEDCKLKFDSITITYLIFIIKTLI